MNPLAPGIRAAFYAETFPRFPSSHLIVDEAGGRFYGMWLMGQNYRSKSGYYGSYPPNYLARVEAFFPDAEDTLHLFSGSLPPGDYTRFDCRKDMDADVHGDAHHLIDYFEPGSFDLVFADPPYSEEDAKHYGTAMVKRQVVLEAILPILRPGGWVVWLDQVWPMYRKTDWTFRGTIGMVRSTNHRVRVIFFWERP